MKAGLLPVIVNVTFRVTVDITFEAVKVIGNDLTEYSGVPVIEAAAFSGSAVKVKPRSSRLVIPNLAKSEAAIE